MAEDRRRRKKNKWGDESGKQETDAPTWVKELYEAPPNAPAGMQNPIAARLGAAASNQVSKEMEIPSAVMGDIIGKKGATISQFRSTTGVHVQVISNPTMPFGKLQIGPGAREQVDKCVELVNGKLLDFVARGQAQAQATGIPPNIPPTLMDAQGNYLPIPAQEIDAAQQLAELQDLGPTYPGGIIKELTIPSNLMGGIIGPRQSTLSQIRKAAKIRIEIASQPKPGQTTEGVLRVGPAPPEIITKCEELIQMKSEELLGQRPRSNAMSFANHASTMVSGGPKGGGHREVTPTSELHVPPGHSVEEVEVPKELMGAVIGSQGTGIERLKSALANAGLVGVAVAISQNPARDATLPCGKLRLGPAEADSVAKAVVICKERVDEVRSMRDATKGKLKGGAYMGGKGMKDGGKDFPPAFGKGKFGKDGGRERSRSRGRDNFGGGGSWPPPPGGANPYDQYGGDAKGGQFGFNPMGMGGGGNPNMMGGGNPNMMGGGNSNMMGGGNPHMMGGGNPNMMGGGNPNMMGGGNPNMMGGGMGGMNPGMMGMGGGMMGGMGVPMSGQGSGMMGGGGQGGMGGQQGMTGN